MLKINYEYHEESDVNLIELTGEITAITGAKLEKLFNEALEKGRFNTLIQMEGIKYINSSGIGLFVSVVDNVRSNNGQLFLVNAQEKIQKLFRDMGLADIVPHVKTIEEGFQKIEGSGR
jgi:anti-sigma B factor antagonist